MSDLPQSLKALSREKKEELLKLLSQKSIKQAETKLEKFSPNPGAQEGFFKSSATVRMLIGGNGLGKTTCLVLELLYTHLKCHPFRDTASTNHTWVIVPGLHKVEDYWRELQKWCPPTKLPEVDKMGSSSIRRLRWHNKNTTTFYSMDQDPAQLEGTNLDGLFVDEPPPRALWVAAYRGLRNNPDHYMAVLALTPISEPWVYTELYQPAKLGKDKSTEIFEGSTYENVHLSKDFIEDFKSRLTPEEVKVRIYGEFAQLQGRVFKEFSRQRHVIPAQPWPEEWPVWVGIDPHSRKPNTAVFIGITPEDNFIVINELVLEASIEDFGLRLLEMERHFHYRVISRRIDNSGAQLDWSRRPAVEILREIGCRVSPMRNREKNVDDSISRIKQLLYGERPRAQLLNASKAHLSGSDAKLNEATKPIPRLKFFDSCPYTIQDMELYSWHDNRYPDRTGLAEKPRKINDDMIDPLRYVVMSDPSFRANTEPQSYTSKPYSFGPKSEWDRMTGNLMRQALTKLKRPHD